MRHPQRPTTIKRIATIVIALLGIGVLIQCGAPTALLRTDTPSSPQLAQAQVGFSERPSGLFVSELNPEGQLQGSDLWPQATRIDAFKRSVSADGTGTTVHRSMVREPDGNVSVIINNPDDGDTIAHTRLRLESDGSVSIISHESNGILSTFDPMPDLVPASLAADETSTTEFSVSSTGERIPDGTGNGTGKIIGIGTQTLSSPIGNIDCFVFESSLSFAIGPARITLDQRAWIDQSGQQLGLVAEEGRDRVTVFGIPVHDQARVSMIQSPLIDQGDR